LLESIAYVSIGFASVSAFLSVTSLLLHYAKRAENPQLTPVYAAIEALRLSLADVVDRVEHWQKRDRARRVREQIEPEQQPPIGPVALPVAELKAQVRNAARSQGIIR